MARRRQIFEGKAKVIFEGPEPGTLVQHFKDDATALSDRKSGVITGKGVLNNRISEYLMTRLGEVGIPTHFVRRLNMREQLIRQMEIIPLDVIVRNIAAGSICKRLGIPEGTTLPRSVVEFRYKADQMDSPLVSEEHITAFGWATPQELDEIMALSLRINDFLSGLCCRGRHPVGGFQARERTPLQCQRRVDHPAGRRNQPRQLPPVGRQWG